jgi:hypothetical protein
VDSGTVFGYFFPCTLNLFDCCCNYLRSVAASGKDILVGKTLPPPFAWLTDLGWLPSAKFATQMAADMGLTRYVL